MTTTLSPLLAFGDWTLDLNMCTLIIGGALFKILAFLVIAFPVLVILWIFLRDQFCPEFAVGMADDAPAGKGTRVDEELGLIYESRPEEVDDLKHITGVAGVLEGKLHDFGVYRYAQIAAWTDEQAREFGVRLSFSDRVFRDNWREQCAELHRKKYGSDPS